MRRPLVQTTVHATLRVIIRSWMTVYFRYRVHGLSNYPREDGFLICSNHQSNLDPLVVGVGCPRSVNYVGRQSLSKFKPFGAFLYYNNMIPIDREGGGLTGLKETIRRLKQQETVVIFPEGTRTRNGELQPLKMGFATIARKNRAPILPVAMDGSFQAMPRSSWFIRPCRIHVVFGKPITFEEYGAMNDDELGHLLSRRIADCFQEARVRRNS